MCVFSRFGEEISHPPWANSSALFANSSRPTEPVCAGLFNSKMGTKPKRFPGPARPCLPPALLDNVPDGETETQSPSKESRASLQHGDPFEEHFAQIHQIQLRPRLRCDLSLPCPPGNWRNNLWNSDCSRSSSAQSNCHGCCFHQSDSCVTCTCLTQDNLLNPGGDVVACSCPWETMSTKPIREVASIFDPPRSHHPPQSIPTFSHGIAHIRVTIMELHLIWHPRCFSHQPLEHWRRLICPCRTPNQRNVDWRPLLLENGPGHGTSHYNRHSWPNPQPNARRL